ncbi:hypothetical protein TELCIR_05904 [Teladorsagia circumcincta]|uniref:Epg5-like central TPR repeats domain-containing protein n=1 Tax=Teladorsagia circumcincta TaxID=45464 RepID=A0A2G9URP0_TELCI|nr:hypothetical protein TELCIR_05904 [Teladorsagia circumcincta]
MYSAWGRYLDAVTRLAQLFLFTPVKEAFPAEAPASVIQRDFAEVFQRVLTVFSPLIVPMSASVPPFSPSNDGEAEMVLDRFVQLLTAFPHNGVLPPGTQERHFVRFPWPSFYPSERGLWAMDECLAARSPSCAPFVAQVVVRILWKDVLTNHIHVELIPQYLSVLFSVLVRIGSTASNYIKFQQNSSINADDCMVLEVPAAQWRCCFSTSWVHHQYQTEAAKDESSFITNLITSKKTAHSPRLRAVLTILELYLMQQMMGESQLPRATENAPVLNSRIHALKEAASVKSSHAILIGCLITVHVRHKVRSCQPSVEQFRLEIW